MRSSDESVRRLQQRLRGQPGNEKHFKLNERKINIGKVEIIKDKKHVTFPWGSFFNPLNFSQIIQHVLEIKKIDFSPETFIKVPKKLQGNHYESSVQFKEIGKYIN